MARVPADPSNAALLYYQAFLLCPEVPVAVSSGWDDVLRGSEPSDAVWGYLRDCADAIAFAEAATRLVKCDWGIPQSGGLATRLPQIGESLDLCKVLWVSARVLARDGHYAAAFARCMTIRRFAGHIGDDMLLLYAASRQVDRGAQTCIRHILGGMSSDEATLAGLKDQLESVRGAPLSPTRALRAHLELALQTMRTRPDILVEVRHQLTERAKDESTRTELQNLTDEALISRAREPYSNFLDSAIQVMDSKLPYAEAYVEIQRLQKMLEDKFRVDPAVSQIIVACADQPLNMYCLQISDEAYLNALKVGIEIYLVLARTGRVPDKLGDDWPADPLTGDPFQYNRTDEGFVLRHSDKHIPGGGLRPMEFKVPTASALKNP